MAKPVVGHVAQDAGQAANEVGMTAAKKMMTMERGKMERETYTPFRPKSAMVTTSSNVIPVEEGPRILSGHEDRKIENREKMFELGLEYPLNPLIPLRHVPNQTNFSIEI